MLKIGDTVRMQIGALVWDKPYGFFSWAYATVLKVKDINGDCVTVIEPKTNRLVGNVHIKYLIKI